MAKKKKKKGLLPKRIAGVKVPKALRKGDLPALLASPLGVAIVSDALVIAAGRLGGDAAAKGSRTRELLAHPGRSLEHAGEAVVEGGVEAGHAAAEAARRLAEAVAAGVEAFVTTLAQRDDAGAAPAEDDRAPLAQPGAARRKSAAGEPRAAH